MYRLQQLEYGANSIASWETVRAWWIKFPRAGFRLYSGDQCLGGIGLWPITPSSFESIVQGRLDEHELTVDDVEQDDGRKRHRFWYVGDILLAPEFRLTKEKWAVQLLIGALDKWLSNGDLAPQASICAIVYSNQGRSLAKRLGFKSCATTPHGYSVFVRAIDSQELAAEISVLSRQLNGSE